MWSNLVNAPAGVGCEWGGGVRAFGSHCPRVRVCSCDTGEQWLGHSFAVLFKVVTGHRLACKRGMGWFEGCGAVWSCDAGNVVGGLGDVVGEYGMG